MRVSEVKESINNCSCNGCTLNESCKLYYLVTEETICSTAVESLEEYGNEN